MVHLVVVFITQKWIKIMNNRFKNWTFIIPIGIIKSQFQKENKLNNN